MTGGRWRLLATPLIAIAAGLGVGGLSGLVVFGDWLRPMGAVLGATAAVVVLARLATGRPFLPTVAGALAGAWLIVVAYVPTADGGTSWIPRGETLDGLRLVAERAYWYAQSSVAPAEVETSLAGAITLAVVALFLVVDALAVGAGFAASSGFLLLAPWLPALTLERRVPTLALAGALAAWLAVIALSRRSDRGSWRSRARDGASPAAPGAALAATAATVLVALIAAPLAIGGPGWGAMPRLTLPAALGGTSRLDLEIDLRNSLTEQSAEPVLTYTSDSGRVDVLRAYSFGSFDGTQWDRDPVGDTAPATGVLWPEDTGSPLIAEPGTLAIRFGNSAESRVLVPAAPRTLAAGSEWRYDASTDEVLIDRPEGTADLRYTVRQAVDFHTEESLRAADPLIDAGGDSNVPERYLDLNERIDIDKVRKIAETITASATDRFEASLALQEYFRGANFEYSTEVAPAGGDSVSAFLADGRGYCVQFATAMVVMARTLDIPARMAIGYLGGSSEGSEWVVRGRDAHAWPELYFPGHGWVRFEPTPAVQTGERPPWTDVEAAPEETLAPEPTERPTTLPSRAPVPEATVEAEAGGEDGSSGFPWVVVLVLGLAGAAGGAALWARTRARAAAVTDAESAWETMRRRLGARAGDDTLTPAETELWILAEGPDLGDDARASLALLRAAVEDARYAPAGSAVEAEVLAGWVDDVAHAAREAEKGAQAGR
ncbi:transglutaminase family protein [Demequina rhizosphaerae]|uniref:transglutaminase family protein n=1 Tax=Demequina rhizosphaerae TaxID=1638985 RepID=UPI00078159C0|nr:transglutaminase domain-containing protein [Demequina rhizosphaerae]